MNQKTTETITKYLGDMHALESHGLQAISRQVDEIDPKDHPEAHQLVVEFKRTLEAHIAAVDARAKALGGSPTGPVKDAASTVAGVAAGLYNAVRTELASKSVRDDYTFLSLDNVSYLMLHATALSLGDSETAGLAGKGYRDCAHLIEEIDRVMPTLVLQELRQDGFEIADPTEACARLVHESWRTGSVAGQAAIPTPRKGSHATEGTAAPSSRR